MRGRWQNTTRELQINKNFLLALRRRRCFSSLLTSLLTPATCRVQLNCHVVVFWRHVCIKLISQIICQKQKQTNAQDKHKTSETSEARDICMWCRRRGRYPGRERNNIWSSAGTEAAVIGNYIIDIYKYYNNKDMKTWSKVHES